MKVSHPSLIDDKRLRDVPSERSEAHIYNEDDVTHLVRDRHRVRDDPSPDRPYRGIGYLNQSASSGAVRIDPLRPKIEAAKQLGVQPTTVVARLIASADSCREPETTIRVLEGSGTSAWHTRCL